VLATLSPIHFLGKTSTVITRITGKISRVADNHLSLEVGAFEYEVLICEFARRQLQNSVGQKVQLHTVEYLDGDPVRGRLTPRMIGFTSEAEQQFFEAFCSVDGVGVKKALRAMIRPVQEVATAIEQQDAKALSALPGIGPATADRVIAKLRRKMAKFALMVPRDEPEADVEPDVVSQTFDALRSLGHGESHARKLVDEALARKKKYKTVESLLQAIYDHSHA